MNRKHVALVFGRELLDLRRERRVVTRLFLQPVVFVLLMAAPAFFVQQAEARSRTATFTVAVEGPVEEVPGLRAALSARPFRLRTASDAAQAVVGGTSEIGLRIGAAPPGAPVPLEVVTLSTENVGDRAVPALHGRLAEVAAAASRDALGAAGQPVTLGTPLAVATEDVATTSPEGVRFGIAQALPALLVIQLFGLVNLTQERIAGAKDKRTLESLLVLPAARLDLLAGTGLAAIAVGALSSVVIFVPTTLALSRFVASVSRSVGQPVQVVVTMVVASAMVALVFTAMGLLLGARAGSGSEGSVFATLLQLAVFATVLIVPFLTEVAATGSVLAVPVIGPLLFVRDGVASGGAIRDTAVLLASQAAVTALILRAAARSLERDRNVLRAAAT